MPGNNDNRATDTAPAGVPILARDDPRVTGWLSATERARVPCASCGKTLVLVEVGCCLGDAICQES
jgi:hypothetical protein